MLNEAVQRRIMKQLFVQHEAAKGKKRNKRPHMSALQILTILLGRDGYQKRWEAIINSPAKNIVIRAVERPLRSPNGNKG